MRIPRQPAHELNWSIQMRFKVADLFCGAGGLAWGFREAGFDLVAAADFDDAAVETYRANLGNHAVSYDLSLLMPLAHVDVIVGGPPCQGFSSAGMRKAGDARNTLVSAFARHVVHYLPTAFVFENVEGFLTTESGTYVFDLLEPVVRAGYRLHVRKVNAANYGVPQHRKRVVVIGGLGWNPTFPEATHSAFGAPGARRTGKHLPRTETVAEALDGLPTALTQPPGSPEGHYYSRLEGVDLKRAMALQPGQTMRDLPDELHHDSYRKRAFRRVMDGTPSERRGGAPAGIRRLRPDEPSKAITGGARSEFLHPTEHRTLTLRECARLQTFADSFVFRGTPSEQGQLVGNAVPPRLATAIARQLSIDLDSVPIHREREGHLLSFIPTSADGFSPALRDVTERVLETFSHQPLPKQESLWR
ncbi:MAG: DNA cytosine methyltransferase [Bryobacteraceae bacterium]